MATLEELRQQLDEIDSQLVASLNRRAELALLVKEAKKRDNICIYSPERERQILDRIAALNAGGPFPASALERIFTNIISATRSLMGDLSVAYVAPEYSLAHEAAIKQFGENVHCTPEASIEDVFHKVEKGDVPYGVVPANAGSSALDFETFDLLANSGLSIIAEVEVAQQLSLFSSLSNLSSVRRVFSTAAYFDSCEKWLSANLPAAELILKKHISDALSGLSMQPESAIIARQVFGERYSLPELASSIGRKHQRPPRFVVLGQKSPAPTGNDKTSLYCAAKEKAGALHDILRPFAERGVTLLKIESRPVSHSAHDYVFFIDCAAHREDLKMKEVLDELSRISSNLRVLGSYPSVVKG